MYKHEAKQETDSTMVRLAKQCAEDSERWFGDGHTVRSIPHHTLGLVGEVGEFADIVKKIERGSASIGDARTRYALVHELTGAFIYLLNLAALLHVDLEEAYKYIRAENEKRFMEERRKRESKPHE